jgi:tetratricopeptide (TPR) repeat protein
MRTPLSVTLVLACSVHPADAQVAKQGDQKIELGLPGEPWRLNFDVDGFKTSSNGMKPDGRAYLMAENQSTKVVLSVFLEKVSGQATSEDCKRNQQARLAQNGGFKKEKIVTRQSEGMEIVEYTIPEAGGAPVQQRNVFACMPKDDVYIDIHLSKAVFRQQDRDLFDAVLKSAHFVGQIQKSSAAKSSAPQNAADDAQSYLDEGNRYFIKQNFQASIRPYEKALEAEQKTSTLPKNDLRILVDNLGMAYGISGNLKRAEEIFNYGLSRDQTYPLFYYNLACVSAGRNDMNQTMDFLTKAFSYKANLIPGESMPDPGKDDSFTPFLKDKKFQEFLKSL